MKPVFALIGGVASGKSEVARCFARRGAVVIDADLEGHAVLKDPAVKNELRLAFGNEIFDADGNVARDKLAAAVFGNEGRIALLNGITHPRIRERTAAKLAAGIVDPNAKAVVLDISLLLESGAYEGKYTALIFVDCDEDIREDRAISKRGWPEGELQRRQAHQLDLEVKRNRADAIIDNNGPVADLEPQVEIIWRRYFGDMSGKGP